MSERTSRLGDKERSSRPSGQGGVKVELTGGSSGGSSAALTGGGAGEKDDDEEEKEEEEEEDTTSRLSGTGGMRGSRIGSFALAPKAKMDAHEGEVLYHGFLEKKGGGTSMLGGRRNWKQRWFEVRATGVSYFDKEGGKLAGQVAVKNGRVEVKNTTGKGTSYEVVVLHEADGRSFQARHTSREAIEPYRAALERAISLAAGGAVDLAIGEEGL